jgi:hypothetical protein
MVPMKAISVQSRAGASPLVPPLSYALPQVCRYRHPLRPDSAACGPLLAVSGRFLAEAAGMRHPRCRQRQVLARLLPLRSACGGSAFVAPDRSGTPRLYAGKPPLATRPQRRRKSVPLDRPAEAAGEGRAEQRAGDGPVEGGWRGLICIFSPSRRPRCV